ncbi:MAG: FHA domain-containing protein, partial [Cyanobacteria bacterium]|nr:FHA domain-containing protein [Cyanobacteriota bacterium]
MIRLTLNAQSDPEIHLFNKSTILLGAESADVDLVLPGPEIQRQHFKISEENGFLVLSNLTKDPDVSINGHPFGKDGKNLLNSGDVITAYGTTILFELLDCGSNQQTRRGVKEAPVSRLDSRIEDDSFQMKQKVEVGVPSFESFVLPFENEVEPLEKEEWEKFYLDSDWTESSLEEAEKKISAVKNAPVELANTTEPEIAQSSREQRQRSKSLKDDYLKDLDDDNQHEGRYDFESGEKSHLWHAWKWILIFIFTLFTVSAVV